MEKDCASINKVGRRKYGNSLFFKLAFAFTISINLLALCLFYMNFTISEKVFVDTFADSQSKIFSQIEDNFYQFYQDLTEISTEVARNDSVLEYLAGNSADVSEEMQTIYSMQRQISQIKIEEYDNLTMLIVGNDDKSYMYGKAEPVSVTLEEIRERSFTQEAKKNQGELICEYVEQGFTSSTQNVPTVVFCRTIPDPDTRNVLGYVYLIMREDDLRQLYDYFLSGTSDIVILNQANHVISSNNAIYYSISETEEEFLQSIVYEFRNNGLSRQTVNVNGENITYMIKAFTNTNFTIVGMINPMAAFYQKYNIGFIILLTAGVTISVLVFLFLTLRHQTQALHKLITAMKNQKDGKLNTFLNLKGTEEIQELSNTYNEMLTNLNHYINRVMETEKDKRNAEFRALQMQINPHYIYNTLASMKWLIMLGDTEKATEAMDAFIALLRNTISDKEEFLTMRQELDNLQNYVLINRIRYGNRTKVEFYVPEDCMDLRLPKMVLQPFIENAFFHAFPDDRGGSIHVFVKRDEKRLIIEISDDGVGMTQKRANSMLKQSGDKEHFTGIGIKNVDERLKMIYGTEYGVRIHSEEAIGTTVTVEVPIYLINTSQSEYFPN